MSGPNVPLPPRQTLAAPGKWPVVGERAAQISDAPWTVSVSGLVAHPRVFTLEDLHRLPQVARTWDIHCVTRWSKQSVRFAGVLLADVLAPCATLPKARFVSLVARSERNHSTSLPLPEALALETLVAFSAEGEPLAPEHGGPVRTVTPGRYFYKSLKWLTRIEVRTDDKLGYWEAEAGYHNHADPWREERYIAPNAPRHVLERALQTRDFSDLDLRGLQAAQRDLSGLRAERALLRDAHFEAARLIGANFQGANLSNAHFEDADLTGADFTGADVEGAAFDGATLTGTRFAGASFFGATGLPA